MKLYKFNNKEEVYELDNLEIAKQFLDTSYSDYSKEVNFCVDRDMVMFISEHLRSTWDWDIKKGSVNGSKDLLDVCEKVDSILKEQLENKKFLEDNKE